MKATTECGHALGLDVDTERDEDGVRKILKCHACGEVFDMKTLDGKTIAVGRVAHASGDNYATITLSRTTSAKNDDE